MYKKNKGYFIWYRVWRIEVGVISWGVLGLVNLLCCRGIYIVMRSFKEYIFGVLLILVINDVFNYVK